MRVNGISWSPNIESVSVKNNKKQNMYSAKRSKPLSSQIYNVHYFYNFKKINKPISFLGKNVFIVDGGNHATNMKHFVHAIAKQNILDTEIFEVSTILGNPNMKSLKDLEKQLKNLKLSRIIKNAYVAIPALASVPILNLQDQYNAVMNRNQKLTPENLKTNKGNLLEFLKEIYTYPNYHRQYINYMDKNNQGIEYTYGVIKEINELKEAGAKVYIPSGHPQDETLKWMAGQRGLKPELYHFIATGKDKNGLIFDMHNEIKKNNWYDFNLLSLSDANVVGVKGAKGPQDYMFAAYDSCITDGERGVYNFTPIREKGKLVGYSYTDKLTNEYPFDEFPANNEISNLTKFVGLKVNDVLASKEEHLQFKESITNGQVGYNCADKLYRVEDVFTPYQISANKIDLQGEFVDKSLKLFFSKNEFDEVIFKKCDCEGSGKPSVLSMWGSCFAVFNAIVRDIKSEVDDDYSFLTQTKHLAFIKENIEQATMLKENGFSKKAEDILNYTIERDKARSLSSSNEPRSYLPHFALGKLHFDNKKYDYAAACFNNALNYLAKELIEYKEIPFSMLQRVNRKYYDSIYATAQYERNVKNYNNSSIFNQIFSNPPSKPWNYLDYKNINNEDKYLIDVINDAESMYWYLANICSYKNESYPSKVCMQASQDIKHYTDRGMKVLQARANGIQYIGDLYDEIKPN